MNKGQSLDAIDGALSSLERAIEHLKNHVPRFCYDGTVEGFKERQGIK